MPTDPFGSILSRLTRRATFWVERFQLADDLQGVGLLVHGSDPRSCRVHVTGWTHRLDESRLELLESKGLDRFGLGRIGR